MSPESEKLAAALDEALSDPEVMRQLASPPVRELLNLVVDPEAAAARERVHAEIDRKLLSRGGSGRWTQRREVAGWVRLGMLSALTAWVAGEARTCPHNPRPDGPVPGLAAAWKPGIVVCPLCVALLAVDSVEENMRCDGCGRVSADGCRALDVNNGSMRFRAGSCSDCLGGAD